MTGDISRSACSSTIFIQRLVHGLQDLRVAAHAQVIIGAPDRDSFRLVGHMRAGKLLCKTVDVIEVAVGLVFVLLIEFLIVEFLVIEFGSVLMVVAGLTAWFAMLGI